LPSSSYRLPSTHDRTPLERRASGAALAIGVNLLLLLVLLGIGAMQEERKPPSRALVVDLLPEAHDAAARPSKAAVAKPRVASKAVPKPPRIILPSKPTIAQPARKPLDMIEMSKEEMAAADIGKLPKAGPGSGGDSEEVGRGPHGEVLYAAEWAREPTHAELAGYLPTTAPEGYGLIACKTIPGNRVDDCIELDQSPRGSHLASAVRQAAWQFRVRPPRKNGKPLIGGWVSIRIDYTSSHPE
jgi:periplasmic protein TonB